MANTANRKPYFFARFKGIKKRAKAREGGRGRGTKVRRKERKRKGWRGGGEMAKR